MVRSHVHLIKLLNTFKPENIFEIGSRDGNDAKMYATEFGVDDSRVFVFEPNPWLADLIRSKYPAVNVRQEAIGEVETDRVMHCVIPDPESSENDPMILGISSLLERFECYSITGVIFQDVVVSVRRMSSVMKELNISSVDVCKIDAEGTTLSVLKSFGDKISRVKSFHLEMEYTPYWKNQILAPEIKEFMDAHNFVLLSENFIGNTDQTDSIWVHQSYLA